jgi:hypothetical protein
LNEFFPGYKSMHRLIFTGVLLAVLIVLGIVGCAHAKSATSVGRQSSFQPSRRWTRRGKGGAGADYIKAAKASSK